MLGVCCTEVQADDTKAIDAVVKADKKRLALLEEQEKLQKAAEQGDLSRADRMKEVAEELIAINAHAAEPKARRILSGLGFTPNMMERATKNFSGGWRMRVSLARSVCVYN